MQLHIDYVMLRKINGLNCKKFLIILMNVNAALDNIHNSELCQRKNSKEIIFIVAAYYQFSEKIKTFFFVIFCAFYESIMAL